MYVDNKGILDGLRKGEKEVSSQERKMQIYRYKFWRNYTVWQKVEHVKAHRTNKEKTNMSQFEKFVNEGNEKADALAKEGAMLDEGFMAEAKAETMQQEREEVYAALQYAASSHCLVEEWKDCEEVKPKPKEKWTSVDHKREETMPRTEWCAEADKYRRMRCGRGSKLHEDARNMHQTKKSCWKNGEGAIWEVMTWSEEWTDKEKS